MAVDLNLQGGQVNTQRRITRSAQLYLSRDLSRLWLHSRRRSRGYDLCRSGSIPLQDGLQVTGSILRSQPDRLEPMTGSNGGSLAQVRIVMRE